MTRSLFFIAACLVTAGCATRAKQTETLLHEPPQGLPRRAVVTDVPFIEQAANHCGPATLAMATAWAGRPITVAELTNQVYTPGARGSYQADMVSAARRNGLLAIPTRNLPSLLLEVAAGHPVIVFENLAFNWYPMWHYALVYGYDLDREIAIMHSGPVRAKEWDLRTFERSWMLGDYWGLVVLKPGDLAASVDDLAHATAASALEQYGYVKEAETVYRSVLSRWPESLPALIGLGNAAYARGETSEAVRTLSVAVKAHPSSAAAWHNLAIAQGAARHTKEARFSATRALSLAPPAVKASYLESLREYLPRASAR